MSVRGERDDLEAVDVDETASVIFSFGITDSARKERVRNGVATVQRRAAAASLHARL